MKKTLIALSVLAASGAAMAQSSVTLYGIVDVYAGSLADGLTTTEQSANPVRQTAVNSGGLSTSRWGVKGSEDLGGGLKANFNLEQGFAIDTGVSDDLDSAADKYSTGFSRQAWVGLSGGFGEVKLGKTYTPYHLFRASVNNTADFNINATNNVFKAVGGDFGNNKNNQIVYLSPSMAGLSGAVSYAFGEDKAAGLDSKDTLSLYVRYAAGPLLIGFAHQTEKEAAPADDDTKYNLIGASYDFGVAKLTGAYNTVSRKNNSDDKEYQIGVSAPMGPATVYVGYANAKNEVAGVDVEEGSGFTLLATYPFSKRTDVYAGYKKATEKNSTTGAVKGELKQLSLGLRHQF